MNILLVEPDRILAKTVSQALQQASHQVRVAATAQGAVFAADAAIPDLIILEIQLVSHSGIEFLYELRSYGEWQSIPVIIHSHVPPAEFSDSWALLHDELGVQAYHYKPRTSLRKLLSAVHDLTPKTV
jgi:DNA-binding response OmpR family regulator